MSQETRQPSNVELQRESALVFRNEWQPDVEKIRFKREGDRPGLGAAWGVNAVATVGGKEYEIIIGPRISPGYPTGDVPPESPTPPPPTSLTVVYSDGTSEVIAW